MAFGFPAYHSKAFTNEFSQDDNFRLVLFCMNQLNWKTIRLGIKGIIGRTSTGFMSTGEEVTFLIKDQEIFLRSACHIPSQVIDFGKNKKNVVAFNEVFHQYSNQEKYSEWITYSEVED